jgi:hypothetical protein
MMGGFEQFAQHDHPVAPVSAGDRQLGWVTGHSSTVPPASEVGATGPSTSEQYVGPGGLSQTGPSKVYVESLTEASRFGGN